MSETVQELRDEHLSKKIGDRLKNGSWLLMHKPCVRAYQSLGKGLTEPIYTEIFIAFHSGAGRQQPFAVGRCDPYGNVNPMSLWYYATLPQALLGYEETK